MLVVHVLIVWGLVVLALAVAFFFERRHKKGGEKPEYAVALGFVSSSYGVLLGLLVAFGSNHYNDVRHQAQQEADTLVALWDTVAVYPVELRNPARHDILCYMRAIRDYDWPSMKRGERTGSRPGLLWGDQLRRTIHQLPATGGNGRSSAYGRAQSQMTDAGTSRQQLLFFAESEVPTVLWVVIYAGAFLLFLLIAMHYAGRPAGRLVSLGAVVALLTVVVSVLSILDKPYGGGARINPTSLRHAIDLVNPHRQKTGEVYALCPRTPPQT